MAWILALAVPMAVLISTLMAFGRLSSDNEITGFKSTGISYLNFLKPGLFLGIIVVSIQAKDPGSTITDSPSLRFISISEYDGAQTVSYFISYLYLSVVIMAPVLHLNDLDHGIGLKPCPVL